MSRISIRLAVGICIILVGVGVYIVKNSLPVAAALKFEPRTEQVQ